MLIGKCCCFTNACSNTCRFDPIAHSDEHNSQIHLKQIVNPLVFFLLLVSFLWHVIITNKQLFWLNIASQTGAIDRNTREGCARIMQGLIKSTDTYTTSSAAIQNYIKMVQKCTPDMTLNNILCVYQRNIYC